MEIKRCKDFQVPAIRVPAKMDIRVPDIEVPAIIKWGGWFKKTLL